MSTDKNKEAVKNKSAKKESAKKVPEKSSDFDLAKFDSAQFKERTAEVPVPDMKAFYPEGVAPVMLVRGLTALELAKADDEVRLNRAVADAPELKDLTEEAVQALRVLLRASANVDTPDAHVKMLNIVRMGLVKPKMTHEQVIKFSTVYPVEFRMAFLKINELTGRGQDFEGKPEGSGKNPES